MHNIVAIITTVALSKQTLSDAANLVIKLELVLLVLWL